MSAARHRADRPAARARRLLAALAARMPRRARPSAVRPCYAVAPYGTPFRVCTITGQHREHRDATQYRASGWAA